VARRAVASVHEGDDDMAPRTVTFAMRVLHNDDCVETLNKFLRGEGRPRSSTSSRPGRRTFLSSRSKRSPTGSLPSPPRPILPARAGIPSSTRSRLASEDGPNEAHTWEAETKRGECPGLPPPPRRRSEREFGWNGMGASHGGRARRSSFVLLARRLRSSCLPLRARVAPPSTARDLLTTSSSPPTPT